MRIFDACPVRPIHVDEDIEPYSCWSLARVQPLKGGMAATMADAASPEDLTRMEAALMLDIKVMNDQQDRKRELQEKVVCFFSACCCACRIVGGADLQR